MSVWVEKPTDSGSAVWGCSTCDRGAWCSDHTTARIEARLHASTHGDSTVEVIRAHRGPKADARRDTRIRAMRSAGLTIRAIASRVGISTAGVLKSLARSSTDA